MIVKRLLGSKNRYRLHPFAAGTIMPVISIVSRKRRSTHRHPKIMSLLVGCGELNISTRSRNDNTLPKQSRRLNIVIFDRSHTRDKYYHQQVLSTDETYHSLKKTLKQRYSLGPHYSNTKSWYMGEPRRIVYVDYQIDLYPTCF